MATKASGNFRTLMRSIGNEEVLVPMARAALSDPTFKDFTVKVEGFRKRPSDGWFWPSTHPLWPERLLHTYLTRPQDLIPEPLDPNGTLAITGGIFFHTFLQTVLVREKILVQQPEVCGCGIKHPERAEVFLVDDDAGTRGHADGVVHEGSGFEFKSMTPLKLDRMPQGPPTDEGVLGWFRTKCPDYYAQAQEYLRMSGRDRQIVLILSLTYPFTMREIHVRPDRRVQFETRDKYLRVREMVEHGVSPRCLCPIAGNACPSRGVCHG
jgi:hypothetical protein